MPTSTCRAAARPGPSLYRDLNGQGNVALNRVALDGTPLIAEVSRFADLGPRRIGSIRTDFVYKSRRITTDHLTLNIGRMPIMMSGWTDLDGRIDYQMKISGLNERLPDQARRILGELKLDVGSLTSLTLRGTLDKMVIEVNGVPIDAKLVREPRLRPDDRERLRTSAASFATRSCDEGDAERSGPAPGVAPRLPLPASSVRRLVVVRRPRIPPRLIPGGGRLRISHGLEPHGGWSACAGGTSIPRVQASVRWVRFCQPERTGSGSTGLPRAHEGLHCRGETGRSPNLGDPPTFSPGPRIGRPSATTTPGRSQPESAWRDGSPALSRRIALCPRSSRSPSLSLV